jgi:diaminopimelate epimerase
MEFNFCKMHGAGNDFLMINDMNERCRLSQASLAALCSRHRGIGADGLILLRPSPAARFAMKYFNSDGGEAEMCGNGARCAAKFAHECGIAERVMDFETRAGIVRAEILEDGVRVGIGDVRALALGMHIASAARAVHYGVCGVPHAVIIDDDARRSLSRDEFVRFARTVRHDPAFGAAGANVDVASVTGTHRCSYRTYERGVEDETLACGTGAVVVSAVLAHLGAIEPPVACETAGGDVLEVDCRRTAEGATDCRLKGPVAVSFRGTFRAEDYERP